MLSPAWLADTIATPPESREVFADGALLHYLGWNLGDTHKPGLLLVHGYRAHAHYWDFIAPYFVDRYRVVAMDLSGMGDSGHRREYTAGGYAQDIAAVVRHAGLGPAVVIGHSFGGARALRFAADFPELVAHVIVLDSIFRFSDSPPREGADKRGRTEPYPDYASARARYRLTPAQPVINEFLVDHVARHSITQVEGGWLWKFDPDLPLGPHEQDAAEHLSKVAVPVDVVRGEFSTVVSQQAAERVVRLLAHGRGPIVIPQAYHYLMLDQPIALIATLRALLA